MKLLKNTMCCHIKLLFKFDVLSIVVNCCSDASKGPGGGGAGSGAGEFSRGVGAGGAGADEDGEAQ